MWFFMQFFLQTNVYLNKWTRYSVHGISEQAIIYARHTWLVCVKRTGITASPKQSGDQVKTCSPVFLDHIRYEFSMIFFHGYDDTHTQSLSIFAIIYYPGLLKHCRTVMDPTTLQGPLPLFLIRLWRKSRMWNPFIMKIVVTSTCRRTKTLTITHLSQGLVRFNGLSRFLSRGAELQSSWGEPVVWREKPSGNLLLGWGFDFGRMGFQWMAFWWPWPFWQRGVWQRPIALRPLDGGRPIAWSTCDLCLVLTSSNPLLQVRFGAQKRTRQRHDYFRS